MQQLGTENINYYGSDTALRPFPIVLPVVHDKHDSDPHY